MQPVFRDVLRAWPIVRRHLARTPLYRYTLLSARGRPVGAGWSDESIAALVTPRVDAFFAGLTDA